MQPTDTIVHISSQKSTTTHTSAAFELAQVLIEQLGGTESVATVDGRTFALRGLIWTPLAKDELTSLALASGELNLKRISEAKALLRAMTHRHGFFADAPLGFAAGERFVTPLDARRVDAVELTAEHRAIYCAPAIRTGEDLLPSLASVLSATRKLAGVWPHHAPLSAWLRDAKKTAKGAK